MRLRYNLFLMTHKKYLWFMKTIDTALNFDASDVARFRLQCINLFTKHGWRALITAYPNVSKRSLYRWKRGYLDSGKRLTFLIPKSTRPHNIRQMQVPSEVLGFIKALREQYPRLSKYKIKPFLDIFCEEQGLDKCSVSWIGKLINRYQLFFKIRREVRRKRRTAKAIKRIKGCPQQKDIKLGYLQLDGVVVSFMGTTYYFLSAIELKTRQAWAKRVPSFAARHAKLFLEEIISQVPYEIHTIQTDNGSEFFGVFRQAIEELTIEHLRSYPKTPQTQGYVERFNWTLQDEFINYEIDAILKDKTVFDQKLNNWLIYYNNKRPHQALNYQTPMQELKQQLQLRKEVAHCAKSV